MGLRSGGEGFDRGRVESHCWTLCCADDALYKLAPRAFLSALIQKCGNYDTVAPVVAGARWMEGGCRRRDANLTASNSTRPFITARQPNLDVRLT